jgi:hypothetical protein
LKKWRVKNEIVGKTRSNDQKHNRRQKIGSVFEWIFLRHIEGNSFQTRKVMYNT